VLSVTRLERINGHAPTVQHDLDTGLYGAGCECNCDAFGDSVILWGGEFATEKRSLEALREIVLSQHRLIALQRSGWHCEGCGAVQRLSVHHKVFRSHQRDDKVSNLKVLCLSCHSAQHLIY
jgi:5-methylcytosine-specific restriction endonuclease McrA